MEATISVICFKSKTLADGTHPLMLRITKDRKRSMKSLGVSVSAKHWDFRKNEPKSNCPNRTLITQLITQTKLEYQKRLLEKQTLKEEFTSETFVKEQTRQPIRTLTVEDFYEQLISALKTSGKIGNSYAYLNSYNSLKAFHQGKKLTFLFGCMDIAYLKRYEAWLRARGNKETTISYFFRTLRAAYNKKAVSMHIVRPEKNPFYDFKVGQFNTKTPKRALVKDEVMRLIDTDVSHTSFLRQFAQDIFAFSYLCGGISFVDIANLTLANIQQERLVYQRQKTHGHINLPLTTRALAIICKYESYRREAVYLFPILNAKRHITPMQKKNRVHKVCHQINQELRVFAKELGIETEVTTYVARHTFATVLKRSGVNVALISESLGHSDLSTTQIYLDSFENAQIDEAMKHLL